MTKRVLIIIFVIVMCFFVMTIIGVYMQNRPPLDPVITYGEFPFRFEYEIDGERFVIEDVLIAEFEGSVRGNLTTTAARRWQTTLLNDVGPRDPLGSGDFLLKEEGNIAVLFSPGFAHYFMGDIDAGIRNRIENDERIVRISPHIVVRGSNAVPTRVEDAHDLLAEYGITLISWEYTPPIENSFR